MRSTTKLTLAFLPAFAALIALGVWQIQRLHWKEALIAQVNANIAARRPSRSMRFRAAEGAARAIPSRACCTAIFNDAQEAYAFATADASGAPDLSCADAAIAEGGPKGRSAHRG